jgi:hypothetical protein
MPRHTPSPALLSCVFLELIEVKSRFGAMRFGSLPWLTASLLPVLSSGEGLPCH